VAVLGCGQGAVVRGHSSPKSCPGPQIFNWFYISLSRCCLPNDEGPGPPNIFFLEPPLVQTYRRRASTLQQTHYQLTTLIGKSYNVHILYTFISATQLRLSLYYKVT